MEQTVKTSTDDLRNANLKHYDQAATKVNHWSSYIHKSIHFYSDYRKASIWKRIIIAFKTPQDK